MKRTRVEKSRKKMNEVKNAQSILNTYIDGKNIKPLIENDKLCPILKLGKTIGEGSFGVISILNKPKFEVPVIVKQIKAKESNIGYGSEIFTETVIGALFARDYNNGETMNFPRLFSSFICNKVAYTISERLSQISQPHKNSKSSAKTSEGG